MFESLSRPPTQGHGVVVEVTAPRC
jgi:hypothetical protein